MLASIAALVNRAGVLGNTLCTNSLPQVSPTPSSQRPAPTVRRAQTVPKTRPRRTRRAIRRLRTPARVSRGRRARGAEHREAVRERRPLGHVARHVALGQAPLQALPEIGRGEERLAEERAARLLELVRAHVQLDRPPVDRLPQHDLPFTPQSPSLLNTRMGRGTHGRGPSAPARGRTTPARGTGGRGVGV